MKYFLVLLFLVNGFAFANTLELKIDKICIETKKDLIEISKILFALEEKQALSGEPGVSVSPNVSRQYKESLDWFLINSKIYKDLSCYERRGTTL